jgi:hypothetical protein
MQIMERPIGLKIFCLSIRFTSFYYPGQLAKPGTDTADSEALMSQENRTLPHVAGNRVPLRSERRRHLRSISERIVVTFLGADHEPVSWSAAGFRTADRHPHSAICSVTEGFLTIRGQSGRFPMRIELIRRDSETGEAAFRFVDPSPALLNALASIPE